MSTALVGRDTELTMLVSSLDSTKKGNGKTVVLSGEPGIGKSRLISEIIDRARAGDFMILSGSCMPGISSAFLPFLDALKSGGMENLMAESAPKVICAYLTNNGGLVMSKYERNESALDADIFSSMLTAVNSFVQDSLSMLKKGTKSESLNRLGYGDYTILIESSPNAHLAVITEGRENEFLIQDMKEILARVRKEYGDILTKWGGDISQVQGTQEIIAELVTGGKYEGIDFSRDDPKLKRIMVMENVTRGLVRTARDKPVLLTLDDLQWADSSSLALLHYLARNVRDARIFIVGAYRSEELTGSGATGEHPLVETLRLMGRDELFTRIDLKRLDASHVSKLIGNFLGKTALPENFADRIYREGEGNPLFVLELLKLLSEEKTLTQKDGVWEVDRQSALRIPSKIYDIIMRRLAAVPSGMREILDCASVAGTEFASAFIEYMMKIDKITLLKALGELESGYRLIRSASGGYVFDHSKIREVVYFEIPAELRMEYHRMLAERIENANRDGIRKLVPLLAHHYSSAQDIPKSIEYLKLAAKDAKNSYANKEAIRLLSSLLGFMEKGGVVEGKSDILDSLADVYSIAGEYESAIGCYSEMLKIMPPRAPAISDVLRKTAIALFKKGSYSEARETFERAVENARTNGEPIGLARAYLDGCWLAAEGRDFDLAQDLCDRAAAILEKYPDAKKELAQLYNNFYIVGYHRNDQKSVLAYAEKSLGIREEMGDRVGLASSYNAMGLAHLMKGETGKALEWYGNSVAILEKVGDLYGLAGACLNIGNLHSERGEWGQAIDWTTKSLKLSEKLGERYSAADACNNLGNIYLSAGKYDLALEWHGKNLWLRERLQDADGIARAYANMAEVFKEDGAHEKAVKNLLKSIELSQNLGNRMYLVFDYNMLAECYLHLKDFPLALSYANKGLEMSRKEKFRMFECAGHRILGTAYSLIGNAQDAEMNFKKSIELGEGNEMETGKTGLEYGRFLVSAGRKGDGKVQIEKAMGSFERLHMAAELKKARDALALASA